MIEPDDYEKIIYSIKDMDDVKDYLKELTRFVLYDLAWGKDEAHTRFLNNLNTLNYMKKFRPKKGGEKVTARQRHNQK